MIDILTKKINQMQRALGALTNEDLSSITVDQVNLPEGSEYSINLQNGIDTVDLDNAATTLINNIASLKDHIKLWCKSNGKKYDVEALIDSNRDIAIIHDLWNIDKHGKLDRSPRSGHLPKIVNLTRGIQFSTSLGSGAGFEMGPEGVKLDIQEDSSAGLVIDGEVIDEHGNKLGNFAEICNKASEAWENAIINTGITITNLGNKNTPKPNQAVVTYSKIQTTFNIDKGKLYFDEGDQARRDKDFPLAIQNYTKAVEETKNKENKAHALFYRALAKEDIGDFKGALLDYNDSIKLSRKSPTAYFNRALIKEKLGDMQGAAEDYKKVIGFKGASAKEAAHNLNNITLGFKV